MSQLITTYLQDHRAGSVAGVDAFRRVAEGHGDPEVRTAVARIAEEVEADQADHERIMAAVGAQSSALKDIPAKIGEKVARLKPTERITKRSPLSDVLELEVLVMAVHGKGLGWRMLVELDDPRLDRADLERLADRAWAQHEELDRLRLSQAAKLLQD